jgi:hypothetical protein
MIPLGGQRVVVLAAVAVVAANSRALAADAGYVLPAWAQWVTVGAAIVAALGVVWAALVWAWRPIRKVRQWAWRRFPMQRASVTLQELALHGSSGLDPVATWTTNAVHGRQVNALNYPGPEPTRLDFKKPRRQTVRKADLAVEVPGKRDDMIVRKFIPGGFVIDEGQCIGDQVEVHIFF